MAKYQITAIIEKLDFENSKLQLKGAGKWFFESENDTANNAGSITSISKAD